MKNPYDVIIRQLITEKSTKLAEANKYTFEVSKKANKIEVKNAVEAIWNRKVDSVTIINVRKKPRKMGRYEGFVPAVKKAIVTLKDNEKPLDVFEL